MLTFNSTVDRRCNVSGSRRMVEQPLSLNSLTWTCEIFSLSVYNQLHCYYKQLLSLVLSIKNKPHDLSNFTQPLNKYININICKNKVKNCYSPRLAVQVDATDWWNWWIEGLRDWRMGVWVHACESFFTPKIIETRTITY